ncbi:MAG: LysE family translocator, partial [Acidobacteriota bacterium]
MLWVLTVGITIGLSAGLAPGPLMTLVVSHSLRFGFREGLKVALAPIFSDLPIVGLSIGLTAYLSDFDIGVVVISLAGGIYLCFLAWETAAQSDLSLADEVPIGSIRKGTLVNLLNPHPYLFWITVGAPLVFRIWEQGWHLALFFVAGFYVCLVGCKIIIAWLVSRSR